MSSNESAPRDLHDDVSNITIASKKWEIGDKIRAFWKQTRKKPKNGRNVFGSLARRRTWRGHSRTLGFEKKTNKIGQASWADRSRRRIIALFLAIQLWSSFKNSNEISRDPNEYLLSQIRWSVPVLIYVVCGSIRASSWEPFCQNSGSAWI